MVAVVVVVVVVVTTTIILICVPLRVGRLMIREKAAWLVAFIEEESKYNNKNSSV
jgi:hypothetical protein